MSEKKSGSKRRVRQRLRGKTGAAIGIASLAAPIAGFVVNDLKKPDSIIRNLARIAAARFLPTRKDKPEVIDITDRVEVTHDETQTREELTDQ